MSYTVTASHIALGAAIEAASGHLDVATAGVLGDAWKDIKNKAVKPALAKIKELLKKFAAGVKREYQVFKAAYTTKAGLKVWARAYWRTYFNQYTLAALILGLLMGLAGVVLSPAGAMIALSAGIVASVALLLANWLHGVKVMQEARVEWEKIADDISAKQKAMMNRLDARVEKAKDLQKKLAAAA